MSLGGNKKRMLRKLTHFHNTAVGRQAGKLHSMGSQQAAIIVVDFIAVSVPFVNGFITIKGEGFGRLVQNTGVRAQTKSASDPA